ASSPCRNRESSPAPSQARRFKEEREGKYGTDGKYQNGAKCTSVCSVYFRLFRTLSDFQFREFIGAFGGAKVYDFQKGVLYWGVLSHKIFLSSDKYQKEVRAYVRAFKMAHD